MTGPAQRFSDERGAHGTAPREPALIRALALSRWCGTWKGGLTLMVLCLAVMLPGLFSLPVIDRDEARFAQASRQMLESGDLVLPRVLDRPRLNKPPLVYWLQSASARVWTRGDASRDAIWMYRLPGVLCMVCTVMLTWRLACRMHDPRVGWLAAAMLACCPLVVFEAHQARADQLLMLTVVAAQFALWRVLRLHAGTGRSWWQRIEWTVVLWACVGAGVLAKGPITPLVAATTILMFCMLRADWTLAKRVRPLLGVMMVLIMVLPWVIAAASRVGWREYATIIVHETFGRSVEAKEGHGGIFLPGVHLVLLVGLFFPGSLLTGLAVGTTLKKGLRRAGSWWRYRWIGKDADLFLLAWILPTWIVMELIITKLPHYTMPLYPAVAILTARAMLAGSRAAVALMKGPWVRAGYVVWALVGLALSSGSLVIAGVTWLRAGGEKWGAGLALVTGVVCAICMLIAMLYAMAARPLRACAIAGAVCVLTYCVVLEVLGPRHPWMWMSRRIANRITEIDPRERRDVASVGYHEDSLIFETRGRVELIRADEQDAWTRTHPRGLLLRDSITERETSGVLARWRGFNYSKGRMQSIELLDLEQIPERTP